MHEARRCLVAKTPQQPLLSDTLGHPREQPRLFPVIQPVMEKVGAIVSKHIGRYDVGEIYLVGGTTMFPGMGQVVERVTGIKTIVPPKPLFITPLGIAMNDLTPSKR